MGIVLQFYPGQLVLFYCGGGSGGGGGGGSGGGGSGGDDDGINTRDWAVNPSPGSAADSTTTLFSDPCLGVDVSFGVYATGEQES